MGISSPTLPDECVGSLMSAAKHATLKMQETGPTVYSPYPRPGRLTICSCHYKGSTFFSVIERPSVLVQLRFETATSRTAVRCSTNWANWSAVDVSIKQIFSPRWWIQMPRFLNCNQASLLFFAVGRNASRHILWRKLAITTGKLKFCNITQFWGCPLSMDRIVKTALLYLPSFTCTYMYKLLDNRLDISHRADQRY